MPPSAAACVADQQPAEYSSPASHGTPAPSLVSLRAQVDRRWPGRARGSDGIMGDARHHRTESDHNLGNALDLTHAPPTGFDAHALADRLRRQMAAHPGGRLSLIISDGRKASARSGWRWVPYTGPNPHRTHCHLSIRPTARHEFRPWSIG